ncbi:MAG: hypothetical protein [Caudoviricetes sp.]|nr:MAG: hypothetical protein [Caudoviricetes sp.]
MPGIENNLYPPIIETYMPAFVRTTACRVYFSLSNFNNIRDILNAQVVVNNQNTNLSALRSDMYPAGIKITSIQTDETIQNDSKYYIIINPGDLTSNKFELNQFYKVQIRFTKVGASPLTSGDKIAPWLVANQQFFSEWSTVCLIRGISKPKITLNNFEENEESIIASSFVEIVGKMYFEENSNSEDEYLEFYRVKVYDKDEDYLKYDSGDIFTNTYNPNEINYTIKTILEEGINYEITFSYSTVNGYSESLTYNFIVIQNSTVDTLNATIEAEGDKENGRVMVRIVSNVSQPFIGHLVIKRTSSKTNFSIWEEVNRKTISNTTLNYTWIDYTCESGVLYYYCAQKIDSEGDGGIIIKTNSPIMIELEDIFLLSEDLQIKVKFNPSISSFRNVLMESKIDTLGSKYPFVIRNGNVNYKEFPISGLISSFWDEEGFFINKDNIYEENKGYYINHNEENKISEYYDYIYERNFREKIMEFLYKDNIKLFRSNTEGNILIKLMDISFTPEQTLGRMLYEFSATAYEIDECSIDNYHKYNIQSLGDYKKTVQNIYFKLGQINGTYSGTGQDILKIVQNELDVASVDQFINKVKILKWVRFNFNSDPYFIKTDSAGNVSPLPANEKPNNSTLYGYIVYINGIPIVVNKTGIYELVDDDTNVTSIYFPVSTDVSIDYVAEISQEERPKRKYSKISYITKVGQESDLFSVEENVFGRIYLKHTNVNELMNQQFLSLDRLTIEADPGTVVYVKDSSDDQVYRHIIGDTGVLDFNDNEETTIEKLYFNGLKLYPKVKDIDRPNYFSESGISVSDFQEIANPKERTVYTIDDIRFIFYLGDWYEFTEDNIVLCPAYALVDYIFEMMIGEYVK